MFADAAAEWLRYIGHDRGRKPSTVAGYKMMVRSMLLPAFGELQLEAISTPMIERWIASLNQSASTRTKALRCSRTPGGGPRARALRGAQGGTLGGRFGVSTPGAYSVLLPSGQR